MDSGNKLIVIVAGVFVLTFLPIIIVIALILGAIGGLDDEADPCAQIDTEKVVTWQYPVPSGDAEVTKGYDAGDDPENPAHGGLDFDTTDVLAAADGDVISTDDDTVVIKHGDGFQSVYKYLDIEVGKGAVTAGKKLGTTKSWAEPATATATRHLHFEITVDNSGEQMALDAKELLDDSAGVPGCGCGGTGEFYSKIPEPWRALISKTAAEYKSVDARLVAATLWAENRGWPTYKTTGWAESPAAAQGPWQFIPSTWDLMKTDGNGDGKMDPNDPEDEVHAAFKHQLESAGKPILAGATGDVEGDFKNVKFHRTPRDNLMAFMANYNGSGAPEDQVLSSFPLGDENSDYVRMGYWLIATDFTKGWLPETGEFVDATKQGEGAGGSGGGQSEGETGGSAGCVAGGPIVETAKGLAWPDSGHGPNESDAKPEYVTALRKFNPDGEHPDMPFSDCGVFVSTVMRMTGVDPDYPPVGTSNQLPYLRSHPEKYEIFENLGEDDVDKLQPGDIFIYSSSPYGHTFIYTGPYKGSDGQQYDSVGASLHGHVPEAVNHEFTSYRGDQYTVARPKGGNVDAK